MPTQAATPAPDASAIAGKYLTFLLGDEEYGIPILRVQEIIGMMDVTPVPRAAARLRGVINLRGKVLPVTELRASLGMERVADTDETCIVVVNHPQGEMGIIVDRVSEVTEILQTDIEPTPSLGAATPTDHLLGLAKSAAGVTLLLDLEQALTD